MLDRETGRREYGREELVCPLARLPGGYGDAEAMFAGTLPVKATTAMRLAADPLADLWTTLPNPLAGAA